jgi:bifunctional non-homologous end joining protein LigD
LSVTRDRSTTRKAKPPAGRKPAARKPAAKKKAAGAKLAEYRRKRDFASTPEPAGKVAETSVGGGSFVIQKHAASRLHYDFRLELDGVLKSWAVPKGPSLDPGEKRLAVHVEDHPLEYGDFEGTIPKGQYGGGTVLLWDRGTWEPVGDGADSYRKGKLKFRLHGEKLHGGWNLVRMGGQAAEEDKEHWLLFKENDDEARPGSGEAIVEERPESVASGRDLPAIAADPDHVWQSNRPAKTGAEASKAEDPGLDPSAVPGARKGRLRAGGIAPQLATLVSEPPRGAGWIHEIKLDGYRILCEIRKGKAKLWTRNGKDWSDRFAAVAEAAAALPVETALLDGEVVVLLSDGTTSFQALQNVLSGTGKGELVAFFFDLLHLDGWDLTGAPLLARKRLLATLLAGGGSDATLRLSEHVEGQGEHFYRQACGFALEGVIAKRGGQPYRGGRGRDWVKVKCLKRQEFVVVGFTDPEGSRTGFGALLLAVHDASGHATAKKSGELLFAGKVGTGFNQATLRTLDRRLRKLEVDEPAFRNPPRGAEARRAHWVRPELVAEVAFTEWTGEGLLRHPSFQGLREDKPAAEVVRERAEPAPGAGSAVKTAEAHRPAADRKTTTSAKHGEAEVAGVRLTHPDKVLFPAQGLTKRDLALYYQRIADRILPYLADRPLTLVRCPEGQQGQCFYQKHVTDQFPATIRRVDVGEEEPYGAVDSVEGLIALVQMGVLEIHVWGARRDRVEQPDYLVFDLDPDEGLAWERVALGALTVRQRLAELGLRSFLKTTGGKGLHVALPIARRLDWDEVKAFTKALAEDLVAAEPQLYTANLSKVHRQGKVFIDYLRNGRGATSIAAWSTRSRPGAPVSTPLFWEELEERALRGNTWTVQNLDERLASLQDDPWKDFWTVRQSITRPMKKALGLQPASPRRLLCSPLKGPSQ